MRRYVTSPRATVDEWGNADASMSLATTVYERENECRDTGLLDQHGRKLYAMDERNPIGFHARLTNG